MATEQQGTLTAPPPANASYPLAYTQIPWNGGTAYALPYTLRDPITGAGAFVTTNNALKVDASATIQPVSINGTPSVSISTPLPAGGNAIGSVSVSNFPQNYGPGQNANGAGQFVPIADTTAAINCSTTQKLVSGVPGKTIYVCAYVAMADGNGAFKFQYNTTDASGNMAVTPETGVSAGSGYGAVLIVPPGEDLNIVSTAPIQGHIAYTQI